MWGLLETCGCFDKVPLKKNQIIPADVNKALVYLEWAQLALHNIIYLLENWTQNLLALIGFVM